MNKEVIFLILFNFIVLLFYVIFLSYLIRHNESFFHSIFPVFILFNLFSVGINYLSIFKYTNSLLVLLEMYFFVIFFVFFSLFIITLIFIAIQTSLTLMIIKSIPLGQIINYEKFIDDMANWSYNIRQKRISFANNSRKINYLDYLILFMNQIYKLMSK